MSYNTFSPIVSNGLVLCLDAANSKSYDIGTDWNDLTSNSNTGVLTNGPVYNSSNGGSIVFDGIDDYVDCGSNTSLQEDSGTVACWVKTTSPGSSYRGIIVKQYGWGLFTDYGIFIVYDWSAGTPRSTGINISTGEWVYLAVSFTSIAGTPTNNASLYINGSLVLVTTIQKTSPVSTVVLGAGSPSGVQNFNGDITHASIYNTVLSSDDILQNYNALKNRFI